MTIASAQVELVASLIANLPEGAANLTLLRLTDDDSFQVLADGGVELTSTAEDARETVGALLGVFATKGWLNPGGAGVLAISDNNGQVLLSLPLTGEAIDALADEFSDDQTLPSAA